MVHDGCYMSKVHPTICFAAFLITCISVGHRATGTIVDKSDFVDNCHTKDMGSIEGLFILQATTQRISLYKGCFAYRDNLGTINMQKNTQKGKPRGCNKTHQALY